MKKFLKTTMVVFVIVLLTACMLFTSAACDKGDGGDGSAKFVKCSKCNGSGYVWGYSEVDYEYGKWRCSRCHGKGYVIE